MYLGCLLLLITSVSFTHAQDECKCTDFVVCPPNSNTTGYGATSFADCVCNPGFVRIEGDCVEMNFCPPNSTAEFTLTGLMFPDESCADDCPHSSIVEFTLTAGTCMCLDGFVPLGGRCEEVYQCPLNSTKPWALTVADCECIAGYTHVNESCVPPPDAPIALIASVAVGGSAVLSGFVYNFMFSATAAPAGVVPIQPGGGLAASYNPAAVRLNGRFIEYQV